MTEIPHVPVARNGTCMGCGAPVTFAHTDGGVRVVLDRHDEPLGPSRYAVWDDGLAHKVSPTSDVAARPMHECDSRQRLER